MIFKKRLKQEEFNKLPQLDRIEFRQRKEDIERNFITDLGSFKFLWNMFLLMGLVILIAVSFYSISPASTLSILGVLPLMIRLTTCFFVILVFGEIMLNIKKSKIKRELNEEYFKQEVKVKTKNEK